MRSEAQFRNWHRVVTIISYLVSLWGLCGSSLVAAGRHDPIPLKLLVFNYSGASASTLNAAEEEASRIFLNASLRLLWQQCPIPLTPDSDPDCAGEVRPGDIRLRVVNRNDRKYLADSVFGFTVAPATATAYFESALQIAEADDSDYELPVIFGCVIAHEIGHLLLGPGAHVSASIMQAEWKRDQVIQAMRGRLLFTSEQARVLRVNAEARSATQRSATQVSETQMEGTEHSAGALETVLSSKQP